MSRFEKRRAQLRKLLKQSDVDALLVTNFTNVTYLTGFTGDDSYVLLTAKQAIILSDPRYTTQLEEECPGVELEIRVHGAPMLDAVKKTVGKTKVGRLGVEAGSMTVGLYEQLSAALPKVGTRSTTGLVEQLRQIKDKEEIDETRLACRYAEKGFAILRATLRPERTERDVAHDLEQQMRLLGAAGCSFPPIVAVGARAALPHARPTNQKIGDADFVLVDWGATARHYKSDLTRVLATGKIAPKLERVYKVVLQAQLDAIAAIGPGVACREVDAVARGVIERAGFGKNFGHGLGHGLGLDIHEAPRFNTTTDQVLAPGMIVTVEPGIYLPGWGGVRIEDDVLVTRDGHEVLTSVPKQLDEIVVD